MLTIKNFKDKCTKAGWAIRVTKRYDNNGKLIKPVQNVDDHWKILDEKGEVWWSTSILVDQRKHLDIENIYLFGNSFGATFICKCVTDAILHKKAPFIPDNFNPELMPSWCNTNEECTWFHIIGMEQLDNDCDIPLLNSPEKTLGEQILVPVFKAVYTAY